VPPRKPTRSSRPRPKDDPAPTTKGIAEHLDGQTNYTPEDFRRIVAAVRVPIPPGRVSAWRVDSNTGQGRSVRTSRRDEFEHRLELAAVSLHFDIQHARAPSPSAVTKRLAKIHRAAAALLAQLPDPDKDTDPLSNGIRYGLQGAIVNLAEKVGGYPGLFDSALAPARFPVSGQTYTDYFPRLALERMRKAIEWLRDASQSAHVKAKGRVQLGRGYKGDTALRAFLNTLAGIYLDVWKEIPTAPWSAHKKRPDSPFVRLVIAAAQPLDLRKTDGQLADLSRSMFSGLRPGLHALMQGYAVDE